MKDYGRIAGALWADRRLTDVFQAICATGGRFAGTESERKARELVAGVLADATGAQVSHETLSYRGWRRGPARLTLADGVSFPAHGLVRSPATVADGIEAEVVDLGRGTPADFALMGSALAGRIALVRHEFMMAAGHIHRRRKYEAAKAAGAAAFLIACNVPGGLLSTGSSGKGAADDIPAAGISHEAGAALAALAPGQRARLAVESEFAPATAVNLHAEIPGRSGDWVVLSAHLDGHDLAQSAIDNASGLAVALALARALGDAVPTLRRGLRVSFFNIEEWGLIGSRMHLEGLAPAAREAIACNVNLDSVAGHSRLTALTSGVAAVEALVRRANDAAGLGIGVHRPFMGNSDHANFIHHGIPALRLLAGFEAPDSNLRFLLTPGDTPDKVDPQELKGAAAATAALLLLALDGEPPPRLTAAEVARLTA